MMALIENILGNLRKRRYRYKAIRENKKRLLERVSKLPEWHLSYTDLILMEEMSYANTETSLQIANEIGERFAWKKDLNVYGVAGDKEIWIICKKVGSTILEYKPCFSLNFIHCDDD